MERVLDDCPLSEIARDRVADRRVVMPQLLRSQRPRRLEEEQVTVIALPDVPEVPKPVSFEPKGHLAQ